MKKKTLNIKVYDPSGNYLSTWDNEVSGGDLTITKSINAGMSPLQLKLLRSFNDFDEGGEVNFNNEVKVYIRDQEANSLLVYDGYISAYAPTLEGDKEYVLVTVLPYSAEFSRYLLRDTAGNTELTYNSYEPAKILKDIIEKYRADGGKVNWSAASVENTGNVVSYTFNSQMVSEAIEKCRGLSPDGFYWYVGADNLIYFKKKASFYEHLFRLGGNILELKSEKRVESMVNRVYFSGGGSPQLYKIYESAGSIAAYGLYGQTMIDGRVTIEATAQTMAQNVLDSQDAPESRFVVKVADSNGTVEGYDIESVSPGDTCKTLNYADKEYTRWDEAYWDADIWDYDISDIAATVLQIVSVEYHLDYAVLELSSRLPRVTHRIEDINRNVESLTLQDNPTAPS